MRMIGRMPDERAARRLSDHLLASGIENEVDASSEGDWIVWVVEERELERAGALWREFERDPEAEVYRRAEREAARRRTEAAREAAQSDRRRAASRERWYRSELGATPWVSSGLGVLALAVAALSRLGSAHEALRPLAITAYQVSGDGIQYYRGLREIADGELWRLVTPILIHFGPLHLLFNLLWLADLGWKVERRRGALYFAALALWIAIPSNLAQYLATGPSFGGLSGVVFGLLGYVWIRNRVAGRAEYPLAPQALAWMLLWLAVCALGLVGPIANWAHGVGLAAGAAWGAIAGSRKRARPL